MSKQLLKAMIMAQPHSATASGSLIHLNKAEFADAQRCIVSFAPVQSGSGDPSPSNVRPISGWTGVNVVRAGRNLFGGTINNLALTAYGSIVSDTTCRGVYCRVIGGQTYTVSRKTIEGNRFRVAATVVEPQVGTSCYVLSGGEDDTNLNVTVTVPSGYNYLFVYLSNQSDNCSADNYMVELGSTATAYAPYNGVTVPVNWNLFAAKQIAITDTNWWSSLINNSGMFTSASTDTKTRLQLTIDAYNDSTLLGTIGQRDYCPKGTITFAIDSSTYPTMNRIRIKHNGSSKDLGAVFAWNIPTGSYILSLDVVDNDVQIVGGFVIRDLMISTTATPYTPYVGTVYGGSVDLTSGTLTVTHGMFTIDSINWYNEGSNTSRQMWSMIGNNLPDVKPAQSQNNLPNAISTIFKPEIGSSTTTYSPYMISFLRLYPKRLTITFEPNQYANVDEMKAAMAGVPIVYELETPITYQLTPTDIKLLRGENNIFSNSNGNIILTYWTH